MDKIIITILGLVVPLNQSLAIPPPDLIISGLQSVAQVLGMLVAFFISLFFLLKDHLKLWWQLHRRWVIFGAFVIGLLSVAGVYWFLRY